MSRICIDGFNLSLARGGGVATYSRNLLSALSELGHETQILFASTRGRHRENLLNLIDLVDAPIPEDRFRLLRTMRRSIPPINPVAWPVDRSDQVITHEIANRFPAADRMWACRDIFHSANRAHSTFHRFTPLRLGQDAQTDIMHWTYPLPLYEPRMRNVYTIHDLIPLKLPYSTLDNKRNYYQLCREMSEKADLIVTDSENSKQDILSILKVPETKVVNTYLAVDLPASLLTPTDDDVANLLESALGLPWKGFYLFFGALEPRKNISRIVEAYLGSGAKSPLVIVGGRAWLDREQKELLYDDLIEASVFKDNVIRRADRVRQYEYMPFRLLVSLIRGARATLFPSLYEGFGLPVLESMLLGTPVLTSGEGSLPEAAGDAALMVDAYDAQSIRRGIQSLEADEDLRADLVQRGKVQAAKFSRAAYLERLRTAYQGLV
jgi:glycosyltransferase involved in cell wall biosynthesis